MPENTVGNQETRKRRIMSPAAWFLYSTALWSILTIPASIGLCYMFKISVHLFNEPSQYSVPIGLGLGMVLAVIIGYFYARAAQKRIA